MLRIPRNDDPLVRLGQILAIALLALAAAPAAAKPPAGAAAASERSQTEAWKDRYCTASRCRGNRGSPWSGAVAFGAAIVTTGWVARRRR